MAVKKKKKSSSKSSKKKKKKSSRRLTAKLKTAIKKAQLQAKADAERAAADAAAAAAAADKARTEKLLKSASLGLFGETIKFEVSSDKILTFEQMKVTQAGRWATHPIILEAPKSEFLGPDLKECSMEVTLSAEHGVKPRTTIDKIEKAVRNGTVDIIAIGGKIFGGNGHKWYIESVSETWDEVWNKGELVKATVKLNFKEYA